MSIKFPKLIKEILKPLPKNDYNVLRNENLLSCAFEVPKQELQLCLATKCLSYLFFTPNCPPTFKTLCHS
jgi:hypothetical protein